MTNFTINATPSELFSGGQGVVSIVNRGPMTAYLGSDPSVSFGNGIPIPVTGQITWNSRVPLWAVTLNPNILPASAPFGSRMQALTTLSTHMGTFQTDTTRGTFDIPIGKNWLDPAFGTPFAFGAETGWAESLILNVDYEGYVSTDQSYLRLQWYDEAFVMILEETYINNLVGQPDQSNTTQYVIPVKGLYLRCFLVCSQFTGVSPGINTYRLTGTNRKLAYRCYDSAFQLAMKAPGAISQNGSDEHCPVDGIYGINGTWGGSLYLPTLGNQVALTIRYTGVTGAGSLVMSPSVNTGVYGDIPIATGSGNPTQVSQIPYSQPLIIRYTTLPVGGSFTLVAVWQDVTY